MLCDKFELECCLFGVIPIALLRAGVANGRNLNAAFGAARSCTKSGEANSTHPSRLRRAACKRPLPRAASTARFSGVVRLPPPSYDCPLGAAQRQSKIDSWTAEMDSRKFVSAYKRGRIVSRSTSAVRRDTRSPLPTGNGAASMPGKAVTLFNELAH